MAQITKKTNKKGETVFQIRVSCGYDYKGRQRTKSMTYKPKTKSPKQIEKEVQKQAILFEHRRLYNASENERLHSLFEIA